MLKMCFLCKPQYVIDCSALAPQQQTANKDALGPHPHKTSRLKVR